MPTVARVAAVYDVHGNLPAFEAVLEAVEGENVDLVVVGGDVVPGPMPSECFDRLLGLGDRARFLRGNGENDLLSLHRGEGLARVPERIHEVMRWVEGRVRADQYTAMESWSASVRVRVEGPGDVLFCHATPFSDVDIFTERTPEAVLAPLFSRVDADAVVCGHTHMAFDRQVGAVRVVNAGSVGLPFGEPAASWALLSRTGIELRTTPYDLEAAHDRLARTEYPGLATFDVRKPPSATEMLDRFDAVALGPRSGSPA